jgi:UDP:flavonoid glycosyltransferase YjiC (YdhE family)
VPEGLEFAPLVSAEENAALFQHPDFWNPVKTARLAARWGGLYLKRQHTLISSLIRPDTVMISGPGVLSANVAAERTGTPLAGVLLQPWMIPGALDPPVLPGLAGLCHAPPFFWRGFWRGMDLLVDSLVGGKLNELRLSLGMPPARRIFRQWLSPPLLLGLFPDWYGRPQADWPAHLQLTGFPLAAAGEAGTLPPTLTGFLNDGPPPVVFTFGTGMAHADRQFALAMEICQAGGWRGIFLTRHRRHLPADFPPSILAVDHAPFADLFPHCAAVVHHGGVGTTAAAMAAGVPQVVMPVCFDQEDNGRRLERLEIGVCLTGRKQTAARLEEALHVLVRSGSRLRSAEIRQKLISADGVRLAADRLEDFAGFIRPACVRS